MVVILKTLQINLKEHQGTQYVKRMHHKRGSGVTFAASSDLNGGNDVISASRPRVCTKCRMVYYCDKERLAGLSQTKSIERNILVSLKKFLMMNLNCVFRCDFCFS